MANRKSSAGLLVATYLVSLLVSMTACAEMFPEAKQMAFEESGQLLPNNIETFTTTFENELAAIRAFDTRMDKIHHQRKWEIGSLLGTCPSDEILEKLNTSQYAPFEMRRFEFGNICFLKFAQPFNPVVLSRQLRNEFGITMGINGVFGGSEDVTKTHGLSIYTFKQGSGDCPSGCIQKHFWEYGVSMEQGHHVVKLRREWDGSSKSIHRRMRHNV